MQDSVCGDIGLALQDGASAVNDLLDPYKVYAVDDRSYVSSVFVVDISLHVSLGYETVLHAVKNSHFKTAASYMLA